MLAPTFAPCVLTFVPYILTFGPGTCGEILSGAKCSTGGDDRASPVATEAPQPL